MVDIAVVDYGMGNLRSVEQALRKVAPEAKIAVTGDAQVIAAASRVVFPGQGAAPDCMREIRTRGLDGVIAKVIGDGKPFLGICMGLQVLFEHSEEGDTPCLGLFAGPVKRFASGLKDAQGNKLKVPHMGWNQVHHGDHAMWDGIAQDARFYFVHSYYVQPRDAAIAQATSDYPQPFVCAVAKGNLFAVQFHPEKSAAAGLKLLQNFINWNPV
ncbi:MAG: imidazole glycerol phosphate synthase, glutamine amidotransferase subunit [Gallionellales bacterium GWA2_60_142]|nr:MAG: imidazole glycerol phosphate synthase, glutamine amidotransferase subunit [Gallionellales bacterium GWA2_60_142]HCI14180.1 imidazole glycerol phosphate synthase subunit HisH [Gallionellaceae bacterium]